VLNFPVFGRLFFSMAGSVVVRWPVVPCLVWIQLKKPVALRWFFLKVWRLHQPILLQGCIWVLESICNWFCSSPYVAGVSLERLFVVWKIVRFYRREVTNFFHNRVDLIGSGAVRLTVFFFSMAGIGQVPFFPDFLWGKLGYGRSWRMSRLTVNPLAKAVTGRMTVSALGFSIKYPENPRIRRMQHDNPPSRGTFVKLNRNISRSSSFCQSYPRHNRWIRLVSRETSWTDRQFPGLHHGSCLYLFSHGTSMVFFIWFMS